MDYPPPARSVNNYSQPAGGMFMEVLMIEENVTLDLPRVLMTKGDCPSCDCPPAPHRYNITERGDSDQFECLDCGQVCAVRQPNHIQMYPGRSGGFGAWERASDRMPLSSAPTPGVSTRKRRHHTCGVSTALPCAACIQDSGRGVRMALREVGFPAD